MPTIIPHVNDITAAARETGRTSPRMPRAMLAEVIRSIADLHPVATRAVVETRGWSSTAGEHSAGAWLVLDRQLDGDGVPALTDADMRGVLVELLIYAAPDEDAARLRWGQVFGLCEESAAP